MSLLKERKTPLIQNVINVNLVGTFNVLRLAAERMADAEPVDGERGVVSGDDKMSLLAVE